MSTQNIESEKRASINLIYPKEYLEGFNRPDDVVVQKYLEYLYDQGLKEKARAVVISPTGRNETETVVYLVTYEGRRFASEEVNWSEPGKMPKKYDEYNAGGGGFFGVLSGNYDIQLRRALLLSKDLGCFVGEIHRNIFQFTGTSIAGSGMLSGQKGQDIIFIKGVRPPRIASLFDSDS